ncbi:hypothetical protein PHYSODRAFT_466880 [Phytophthora sojae]|uniref:CCHC-type domain-containing protein n=1 Tax=Phytophthora sojae (strain P6497) TaxID=1094619 RepID=G4YJT6_PHYSP|nr:hypothetical protein PHYSODRAFT_466880 [Phytophthora sojae]EGZ26643.1 hypothetical protein PHYSODRAFT_466880 [Phytophthora sojae]|eukprot:XP_009513918.1 hypothetical protein PHYSODRAFT_466880 [Phytophthora sojae]
MISFDTFAGPRPRVREADLDTAGLLVLAEQPTPAPELFPALSDSPGDEFYESQDDDSDSCDLFHDGSDEGDVAATQHQGQDTGPAEVLQDDPKQGQEQASGGRIRQLVELLTLQSHNVGDARSALVDKLLGVVKVHELLLTRATEEQIADAANDAITDELLASVDQEERRRNELALKEQQQQQLVPLPVAASTLFDPGQLSPFRVLELVDVLDSTTGGMVKRVLTNVRRRAPLNARMVRHNELEKDVEFCRFCSAYGDHTAAQHKCRLCGVVGQHRSRSCPHRGTATAITASPTNTNSPTNAAEKTVDDQKFCTLCNSWGMHATERHRCRTCGAHGAHRSQRCPASSSSLVPWISSPADLRKGRTFCSHCSAWRPHASDQHRCRLCGVVGHHGSKKCPKRANGLSPSRSRYSQHGDDTSPAMSPGKTTAFCSFCRRKAAHATHEHLCRVCRAVGLHRSDGCPQRSSSSTVLSYSVDAASKVRDRVLETIPQVLPPPAATLVWRSLDKVGDADLILRKTLQRIGVWGGGSQTPITTPYAPPRLESLPLGSQSPASSNSSAAIVLDEGRSSGVYVLSYAEGHSVVPARILKYMRLLMHHEVSTNAFSVVVRFDPQPSHWELMKPGMVSPRSLPSSPTLSHQLQKRMSHFTLQTLLGARDKLRELETARRKLQQRLKQHEYIQTQFRAQNPEQNDEKQSHHQSEADEKRRAAVSVDA